MEYRFCNCVSNFLERNPKLNVIVWPQISHSSSFLMLSPGSNRVLESIKHQFSKPIDYAPLLIPCRGLCCFILPAGWHGVPLTNLFPLFRTEKPTRPTSFRRWHQLNSDSSNILTGPTNSFDGHSNASSRCTRLWPTGRGRGEQRPI